MGFTARQFAFGGATFVNRVIYIDGSDKSLLLDLNLKAAHDKNYDPASLTAGSIVEFIITSGILVSASTTSTYALTNPNTWPSGVFVRLVIESGAIVAGEVVMAAMVLYLEMEVAQMVETVENGFALSV